jgi:glycosyltransferase involved in cell wall biosynthesis
MPDPLRVLMLATYFPKPRNALMGNWALAQAHAFQRQGMEVEVISLTAWVPRWLARTPGAKAYALCPPCHHWDGLPVYYPRWPVYPVRPLRAWSDRYPLPFMTAGWYAARGALLERIRLFQPHVLYAHHTAVNGFLAARLSPRVGLPFVVTDHDLGEIAACAQWPARKRLFQFVADRSAAMVAVARRMENELRALFPHARTCTVHNGTDPVPEAFWNAPRPQELAGKVVVFSCGHFYERKGFPLLVEAFAPVAARHPQAVLRIAGDGATRPQVIQAIDRHNLQGRVILLGKLDHSAVLQEMVWSDFFALVGWNEPFATVFSEAASAGKPIVCANDGGFADVLEDGVHGFAVPPRNAAAATAAMERLVADSALRQRMGAAAKQLFESSLRWDHNARRMKEIFEDAVAGRRLAPLSATS